MPQNSMICYQMKIGFLSVNAAFSKMLGLPVKKHSKSNYFENWILKNLDYLSKKNLRSGFIE